MRLFGLLFMVLGLSATENVNFLNLILDPQGDEFSLRFEPEPLLLYSWLKDENYDLPKDSYDYVLDSPFRQTVFMLRTLERNRGTIMKQGNLEVLSFEFELLIQDPKGEELEKREFKVYVGLSSKRDTAYLRCDGKTHEFSLTTLATPEGYGQFLSKFSLPLDGSRFKTPKSDFRVTLAYKWPRVEVDGDGPKVFDLFPSGILWNQGILLKLKIQLGSSYCEHKEGSLLVVHNFQLKKLAESLRLYTQALEALQKKDEQGATRLLEDFIGQMPADRKALKKLMDLYMTREEFGLADDLIRRAEPLFATIRDGLATRDQIAAKAGVRRKWLLGRRSKFKQDSEVQLKILSPENGDLVSGSTQMEFEIKGQKAALLSAEIFLDNQLVTSLDKPPFKARFTPGLALDKPFQLRVVGFFDNETYQEDVIELRNLKVDQEQGVRLISLYCTAIQDEPGRSTPFSQKDFELTEGKQERPIAYFRHEDAPLRIAMVIDTSVSMFGENMAHAQYAVQAFLKRLAPDDRVSIYSFDQHVLRMSEFSSDFVKLREQVMTMQPQLGTSLYDAMLAAGQDLLEQNGTKVMMVISDGEDSSSIATDIHVTSLLRENPIKVYSVSLPGGIFSNGNNDGYYFLKQIAEYTGSVSTKVGNPKKLDEIFEQVYQDLRSLYVIGYYSDLPEGKTPELKIKVKGGARVKHQIL